MPRGKPGSWEHGTVSGYPRCRKKYGDACTACKAAHADYNRGYQSRGGMTARVARDIRPPAPRQYAKGSTLEELLEESPDA